ncbi:hypothetical protein C6376_41415 [Streptomyces sp. P3]|uniref:DnaB-like helicase C-terminal domain-containing protein n=2 Tax=Streptomyces TaxID=1883 RepID=UPI000D19999B|nr:DnaB-like helicase C-terminal domain-containing protein [Streptomyces sp. P3]AVV46826.1 hypothetical protein C6376_41415 [Streptomyces sp. P3]
MSEPSPPAPAPAMPGTGHETGIPASGPPATPAPRTPRRLAALAQALDTVLPTTVPTGDTTTPTPLMGLSTGIRALDDVLGGLQPGRFYLVAAAPGAGSSLIATAAARTSALDQHQPVLYAASGLTRADIAARIVAAHLPVDYRRLRAGRLTPTEQDDAAALHHHLAQAPLYIDDGTDLTTDAITESVPDLPGLALIVVDRLQTTEDPRLPLSGPSQITDAAQALAHLARTHELPVLAAVDTDDSQLIAALSLDITITLARDADQIHATVTERDLGPQATLTLHADLAHARITDLTHPHAGAVTSTSAPQTPPAVTPPAPAQTPQAPLQAPTSPPPDPAPPRPAPTARPAAPPRPSPRRATAPPPPEGGYANRDYSYFTGMITRAVDEALHDHDGDIAAATEALVKKAVPNAMALFEATRVGGNYEHTVYPETLEFLRKKTKDGADEIWEGRHNWTNTHLMDALQNGTHPPITVNALDTNASFLSAFKTHLPIGALIHQPDGGFDPKRSGIYRLPSRPTWHHPDLPDPIGNRAGGRTPWRPGCRGCGPKSNGSSAMSAGTFSEKRQRMIITYTQDDGTPERMTTDDLSAIEAAAVEEEMGLQWRTVEDRLRGQDPTAMRAVLWAFRRREDPGLQFAAFDVPSWRRRLTVRIERHEIDDVLTTIMSEALAKSEDAAIDAMLPHLRKLAHDRADVDAALDALGKGHLAPGLQDSAD